MSERKSDLKTGARLTLFLVSYLPLFAIMSFTQLYKYKESLNWGGLNKAAFLIFIEYFGAVSVLSLLSIFGVFGLILLFRNVNRRAETSGNLVTICDIENKNSESISYLFTYLIPFVFQDLSELTNVFSVTVLLIVTFLIYSNSSMLLINPTISMKYTIYSVEYTLGPIDQKRKGMIISKNRFLEEDDLVKIKKIGHKLFYAIDLRS